MGLFSKKKLYKVVWTYDDWCEPEIEIVKAQDRYSAWKKVKRHHAISIIPISIKEIKDNDLERLNSY